MRTHALIRPTKVTSAKAEAAAGPGPASAEVRHILHAPQLHAKLAVGTPGDPFEREQTSSLTDGCAEFETTNRLQTKLTIGASNDPLEQEADRVADDVLAAPTNPAVGVAPPHIQRYTGQAARQPDSAPASVDGVLASPGRPLDAALRQDMEQRFGHDFSKVRMHSGAAAEESARDVNAIAYTVGHDIVFGAGQFAPGTHDGRRLMAHELTHVVQQHPQVGRRVAASPNAPPRIQGKAQRSGTSPVPAALVQRQPAPRGEVQANPEWAGPGWAKANRLGIVRVEEASAKERGARLRSDTTFSAASTAASLLLPENTAVVIIAENPEWLYVTVSKGSFFVGQFGYVRSYLIWERLPDPDAQLYWVEKPGLGLQELVENHPQYDGYDITVGDDARSLVTAVLLANAEDPRTKDNVYINQKKLAEAQDPGLLTGAADALDEYRRVLRPILQSVELKRHTKIWLPGPSYVAALKKRDIIPTRPGWKNVAIKVAKGIGGFLSGLGAGIVGSVVDIFTGIYDLVKTVLSTVRDLFSGELFRKAEELYDKLENAVRTMTAEEILKTILNAVTTVIGEMVSDFVNRWTASNFYDKWYFRGKIVGYIAAEVIMAVFSGGASLAAKLLGKLGKVGAILGKILAKILSKVDAVFDKLPGRKKAKHDHEERSDGKSDKAKQLLFVKASAKAIAEGHDLKNSPVDQVVAELQLFRVRYRWIKGFDKRELGPGRYQIRMHASPPIIIDPHYTEKDDEPKKPSTVGTNPAKSKDGPNVPESGIAKQNRLVEPERAARVPSPRYFPWEAGARGNFRGFVKALRKYEKQFKKRVGTPGEDILEKPTRDFIKGKPELQELWKAEEEGLAERLKTLHLEMRKAQGDRTTLRALRKQETALNKKLNKLTDWANNPVGNKQPDLMDLHPDKQIIEITDITQRPYDPSHNFKTKFYMEVMKDLTGWKDVRGLEFATPTVAKPIL